MHYSFSYFFLQFLPTADINVDISKPLKANLSFVRLDQINQFLKKIITTNDDEPRKESAPSAGVIPDEDVILITKHPSTKDLLPAVHTNAAQKASVQENLWRALSCFQKISIHTVQMVVSMETIPHPSKPCMLVSLSNLSGSLNIKSGHKTAGKSFGSWKCYWSVKWWSSNRFKAWAIEGNSSSYHHKSTIENSKSLIDSITWVFLSVRQHPRVLNFVVNIPQLVVTNLLMEFWLE